MYHILQIIIACNINGFALNYYDVKMLILSLKYIICLFSLYSLSLFGLCTILKNRKTINNLFITLKYEILMSKALAAHTILCDVLCNNHRI